MSSIEVNRVGSPYRNTGWLSDLPLFSLFAHKTQIFSGLVNCYVFVIFMPAIFQPGPGAVLRLFDSSRDLKYIANLVSTQFQQNDHFTPQSGYMLAYFLPPKDGAYYFSISCGASSQLLLTDLKLSELKIS